MPGMKTRGIVPFILTKPTFCRAMAGLISALFWPAWMSVTLRSLRPDQRAGACETRLNNRKICFLPAAVRVYSLAMNPTQKQFSLTGVSLNKANPCQ